MITPTKQAALDAIANKINAAQVGDYAPYLQGYLSGAIKRGKFNTRQAKEILAAFEGAANCNAAEIARNASSQN